MPWADPEARRARERERYQNDPEYRERVLTKNRSWQRSNPDKVQANNAKVRAQGKKRYPASERDYHLRTKYGITSTAYDAMLAEQNGVCAICGTDEPGGGKKYFNVDHDHETQEVRGLLCKGCNVALGFVREDVDTLISMATYLLARRNILEGNGQNG